MKNVSRLPKPPSLKKNALRWKRELLAKIKECEKDNDNPNVPNRFYDKYRKEDVKQALEKMYNCLCCYCEGETGVVEFGNIEHRKPKKKYPEYCFDWDNLHLACTRCNTKKGEQYSEKNPILDAVYDRISEHIHYKINGKGIWYEPDTHCGATTVKHVGLNEEDLRNKRVEVFLAAMGPIEQIKQDPKAPKIDMVLEQLDELSKGRYGSVIEYAMIFLPKK